MDNCRANLLFQARINEAKHKSLNSNAQEDKVFYLSCSIPLATYISTVEFRASVLLIEPRAETHDVREDAYRAASRRP